MISKVIERNGNPCVVFKSYKKFFDKENSGRKNNTVRKIDKDKRFELLKEFDRIGTLYIKIECIENGQCFYRRIGDVSEYEDFLIITWWID